MRVAIFGGTFNPIHRAHIAVAEKARDECHLDQVLLIPAANPPHKTSLECAAFEDRFRMVELACSGRKNLAPSRMEEGQQRSFSILTIERLRKAHPEDQFFFLIGADAFAEIQTWFRWKDVIREIEFIIAARPGHIYDIPEDARVHPLDTLAIPVSSSDIRGALAEGRSPEELHQQVMDYIRQQGLYGFHSTGKP